MTKHRLVWGAIMVCVVLLAVCLSARLSSRPQPISWTNFERLRVGMTQAEVEAIFGCPPGEYITGNYPDGFFMPKGIVGSASVSSLRGLAPGATWTSDQGDIQVWFDGDGRVSDAQFFEYLPTKPRRSVSLLDRLRGWLGW